MSYNYTENSNGKIGARLRRDTERFDDYRNSSEIFALMAAFENCTLPREEWTRTTYQTVVFWYLYMNPLPEARRLIRNGIRRYNFEHNLIKTTDSNDQEMLIHKINDYLKQHKGTDSFVNFVNKLLYLLDEEKSGNDSILEFKNKKQQEQFWA